MGDSPAAWLGGGVAGRRLFLDVLLFMAAFVAPASAGGRLPTRDKGSGVRVCTARPTLRARAEATCPPPFPTDAGAAAASGALAPPAPLARLDTEAAFRTALRAPAADGGLVVVGYTAPHCRSCGAVRRRVARLAAEYGGRDVHFFELDVTAPATGRVARAAGLTALPTFHLYTVKGGVPGHLDTVVASPGAVGSLLRDRIEVFAGEGFDVDQFSFVE